MIDSPVSNVTARDLPPGRFRAFLKQPDLRDGLQTERGFDAVVPPTDLTVDGQQHVPGVVEFGRCDSSLKQLVDMGSELRLLLREFLTNEERSHPPVRVVSEVLHRFADTDRRLEVAGGDGFVDPLLCVSFRVHDTRLSGADTRLNEDDDDRGVRGSGLGL